MTDRGVANSPILIGFHNWVTLGLSLGWRWVWVWVANYVWCLNCLLSDLIHAGHSGFNKNWARGAYTESLGKGTLMSGTPPRHFLAFFCKKLRSQKMVNVNSNFFFCWFGSFPPQKKFEQCSTLVTLFFRSRTFLAGITHDQDLLERWTQMIVNWLRQPRG